MADGANVFIQFVSYEWFSLVIEKVYTSQNSNFSVNRILLGQSHTHWFLSRPRQLRHYTGEWVLVEETRWPQTLTHGPLQERSC